MRRFVFVGAFVLAVPLVAVADDPKPEEVKTEIAELKTLVKRKSAELAKAKTAAREVETEGQKVREEVQAKVRELTDAAEKLLALPWAKAKETKEAADKLTKTADADERALGGAKNKLKAANDSQEIAVLKEEIAALEKSFSVKKKSAAKAQTEAADASEELKKAMDAAKVLLTPALRDAEKPLLSAQARELLARVTVANLTKELELAITQLKQAEEKLKASEK